MAGVVEVQRNLGRGREGRYKVKECRMEKIEEEGRNKVKEGGGIKERRKE
jgi:hypothetical protein